MSKANKLARAADAALREIYESLPTLDCQGLCHDTCGRIEECITPRELDRMLSALGAHEMPAKIGCQDCPLLTVHKTCSVYEVRPMICRLWGMVEDPLMVCHHGCVPSRYLSNTEVRRLWGKLNEISRRYGHGKRTDEPDQPGGAGQ